MSVGWWFALLVVLPTLIAGAYYAFVASDIYESEARFIVRTRSGGGGGGGGSDGGGGRVAAMASLFTNAGPGQEEARAVVAYLDSTAAVAALRQNLDLVELWRRPEADFLARLWWERPEIEWLLWYFRRRVMVDFDPETSVLRLRVQAFRPQDAQQLAQRVMQISEELVNTFTARTISDTLRVAQEDLAKAEQRVVAAREAVIAFRQREQAFDPTSSAGAAVETISRLEAALTQARADLQERRSYMRPDNPQIQVLQNRITALQAQIRTERTRLNRGEEALPQQVAGFERLALEQAFADRALTSATASLEQARSDALRQQVFLMRIADPYLPEYPGYPRVWFNLLTVFISLSVLFGIGWLLTVSAREHAS